MNNFEKWKKMSIEEVAEKMAELIEDPCEYCPFDLKHCEFCDSKYSNKEIFIKYLELPAEE